MTEKTALRARMRALRRALAQACPEAPQLAAAHLPPLPGVGVYALYHPVGSELDPGAIRIAGAARALPAVSARDAPLVFRRHEPGDPLVPDALGVPAPGPDAALVRPDVVFVPLLAFDRRGGRLGQGGGYYDRTLAALRAPGPVLAIGVAFAGQELAAVPLSPHDARLDGILTETAFFRTARMD